MRFPKGKKVQEEAVEMDEAGGPIIAADARAVATERAVKRKEKGKNKLKEDTNVGTNVGGAEQDYEVGLSTVIPDVSKAELPNLMASFKSLYVSNVRTANGGET